MPISLNTPIPASSPSAVLPGRANDAKLHKAAQEFEALLIGEMLKSARENGSEGWLGSGAGSGDDSAMDMAESQLANALAGSGGLGLASTIERSMARSVQNNAETQELGARSSPKVPASTA